MASLIAASRLCARPCGSNKTSSRATMHRSPLVRPCIAASRQATGGRLVMRSSSSSDMPPDMSSTGKASSNEGQLQQQQDPDDLGEARPGAVPDPGAAAMADTNVGQGKGDSSSMRDTSDAHPGITPNPGAAALADRNVRPSSEGGSASADGMGVQDRAPATELPSAGTAADRMAQGMGMGNASSPASGEANDQERAGKGSEPGIAGGL